MNQFTLKELEKDYAYCEDIIKRHSKSFYYAFSQLPARKARAVYAIYAFCRRADDVVDETAEKQQKQERLKTLRQELDQFAGGKTPNHPMWRALRDVFNQFEVEIDPFYLQIKGQESDLSFRQPESMEQLEMYSYLVAGSVGLMLLPILSSDVSSRLKTAAVDLGIAMQYTNILRDVGEDFREKQRIYLPKTVMDRFGYTESQLSLYENNESFKQLWETIAKSAENHYDRFNQQIVKFDGDSRLPVAVAAAVYREILDVVRENDYNCFTDRQYVPKTTKLAIYRTMSKDPVLAEKNQG